MSSGPYRARRVGIEHPSRSDFNESSPRNLFKNILFTVVVAVSFALGLYSLFLAYANAGKVQPLTTEHMFRTATAADSEKIEIALGVLTDRDLVYVVLDSPELGPDPDVEIAAHKAARALNDSGLVASVRLLNPRNSDFTLVVEQNGINRFPAVLAVKKNGGIVLVMDDLSEKNLLHAYYSVLGKTSSCDDAKSAVY